jgi:hypothetical protein
MRKCGAKKPVAMKRGGKATVRNPVAKAVRGIKPSVVKPKKGKGSYTRKASSFSSGGAAKVRSAGKEYMASIRAKTPETGVKAKARQKAAKEKIEKDLNKARKGFATPAKQAEMKSGGNVKKKVGKVVKALKKASKSHAGQAKTLSSLKFREGGSTTKKKSKVKTPKGTKGFKGIQPLKITAIRRTSKYESGGDVEQMKKGGKTKSRVNEAGNYTKPSLRKRIFNRIKAGGKGGAPGQWSARKAQMMAQAYKKAGGGYKD